MAGIGKGDDGKTRPPEPKGTGAEQARQSLAVHICFSTHGGLLSWIIRKVTRSPASHALVTFQCRTFQKTMVIEAQGRGLVMVPWVGWKKANQLIAQYELALPEAELQRALSRIADRLGQAYDILSLWGFALVFLRLFKRNLLDSRHKLVCSEAVALFLRWGGIPIADVGLITPRDLLELADQRPDVFQVRWKALGFDRKKDRMPKRRRLVRAITRGGVPVDPTCIVPPASVSAPPASVSAPPPSAVAAPTTMEPPPVNLASGSTAALQTIAVPPSGAAHEPAVGTPSAPSSDVGDSPAEPRPPG